MSHRTRHAGWPVLAALALGAACGGQGRDTAADSPEKAEGLELVAGQALDQRAILLIPRDGGVAELRSIRRPAESVSVKRTELPASTEAHALTGFAVLRTADGTVHRYDPQRDALTVLAQVEDNALWNGAGSRGVFFVPTTGDVLLISESGIRTFVAGESLAWAAPLDAESVLALSATSRGTALKILRSEAASASSVELAVTPPGLVVAWGRYGVFASADGLQPIDLGSLEPGGNVSLPSPVTALAASPSSHRLYAAVGPDGQLFTINRFSGERKSMGRAAAQVVEIRSSLLGTSLLLRTASTSWYVSVPDGERKTIESVWRSDLPLGLPGGQALVLDGDSVRLWAATDGTGEPVGGSDFWWLPVKGLAPELPKVAQRDIVAESAGALSAGVALDSQRTDATDAGPPDESVGEALPGGPAARPEPPGDEVPPGFYAVVGSSLNPDGIRDLVEALRGAGHEGRVQRYRDEAKETWYRALVGPYTTRDEAERAGRRLRAERGLQAWVQEVEAASLRSEG